ncbi:acyltransferase [Modestobacter sp. VKM Ac-2979]|uniref:acyltransferase family protein n=1 Tax=unclassified Modestobacter TaxID=2643866 RepID=UPI0022AB92C6|nr:MULTISPECIES: acyltransferase [unclassified Modestobacter]MCZ2813426.1 acyltransferase [Modestobacter sp. VKM Ac-2979]MCZ2842382.1 acyltransferase [Modestobacter sp. VKM Ac-2980]
MTPDRGAHVVRAGSIQREQPHGWDLLRILAASIVVLSHSYLLQTGSEPSPLVYADRPFNWGRLGVFIFFVISGYLICGSWLSRPNLSLFARKRFRRIYPALALMVLLTAFLVGPLVTTSSNYFGESGTWVFTVRNLLLFPYEYTLPGVFDGQVVNGVLWTLGVEVAAYALIALLGFTGALRPAVLLALTLLFSLAGWFWIYDHAPDWYDPLGIRLGLVAFFTAGAWARIADFGVSWRAAAAGAVLLAVPMLADLPLSIVAVPAITVIVLYLGTRPARWASKFVRLGDPSYGIYVYGYVIQQLLTHAFIDQGHPLMLFGLSLILSMAAGYASWHLWERRFVKTSRAVPRDSVP